VAVLLGGLMGLSLGALGGGGSILTVPALVYLLGEPAHAATTASLVIVGTTSLIAAAGHARAGKLRWRAGVVLGLVGLGTSYAGTALNRSVSPDVLLLVFAVLMLAAAAGMLRRASRERDELAGTSRLAGDVAKLIGAGLLVGFVTGFVGVGGGFVIVPALVVGLGLSMPVAVGTSLVVIALNCASALLARGGSETFHWAVIVPFTAAAVAGSLFGTRLATRVSAAALTRAFATLLVAVALYTGVRSAVGLT
jgi:uncharacterized membrane protein YfcA